MKDIFWSDIIKIIGTLVVGVIVGTIVERIKNKIVILKKRVWVQPIAMARESAMWGKINIWWNDWPINGDLYFISVEIINDTSKDLKNFHVNFSVSNYCTIFNQQASIHQDDTSLELL